MIWLLGQFERTGMVMSPKGCDLLQSSLLPFFSETGSLSKGNRKEMGLSSFNDAENNKENMF